MPTLCSTCGRTAGTCASCAPYMPDTVRREGEWLPVLVMRREDTPAMPTGSAPQPPVTPPPRRI